MSELERRKFLRLSGTGMLALLLSPFTRLGHCLGLKGPGMDPDGSRPTLVTVYLRGGLDQLNTIVPYTNKLYYKMRPTIAIPRESAPDDAGVIKLDKQFGFHPSLASLKSFYDAGRVAPIINVGSHNATRSHFDAQDFMEYAAPGLRTIKDGWLNRYLQASVDQATAENSLRALAMQGLLPRSLRGRYPALAVPSNVKRSKTGATLDLFKDLYGCEAPKAKEMKGEKSEEMKSQRREDDVVAMGRNTIETLEKYKELVRRRRDRSRTKYPGGRFASGLKDLALVIKAEAGLEVAALDIGGWDHHTNEGGNDGTLARMLKNLGDSLAAFMTDLGPALDRTLILVLSEFGRTCRENGNAGSDHGHGGMFLAMGGKVKGGKVHGKWPGLKDRNMYQGRDLQVTTDFRDVFAEVLRKHMGFQIPKDFFPDYKPGKGVGLL